MRLHKEALVLKESVVKAFVYSQQFSQSDVLGVLDLLFWQPDVQTKLQPLAFGLSFYPLDELKTLFNGFESKFVSKSEALFLQHFKPRDVSDKPLNDESLRGMYRGIKELMVHCFNFLFCCEIVKSQKYLIFIICFRWIIKEDPNLQEYSRKQSNDSKLLFLKPKLREKTEKKIKKIKKNKNKNKNKEDPQWLK